jgi:hypothetical protein
MSLVCQQHAANVKDSENEARIRDLTETKESVPQNTGNCWNDAQDCVRRKYYCPRPANHNCQINLKDQHHYKKVGQPTEVSAADDSSQDRRSVIRNITGQSRYLNPSALRRDLMRRTK